MATMHTAHGINQRSDTNALVKLSKLAVGATELTWMLHALNNPGGTDNSGDIGVQMFDVLHKLRVDGAALEPVHHGDKCWICAEFNRIGGDDLLTTSEQQQPRKKIPTKKKGKNRGKDDRRARGVILKARAARKRSPGDQDESDKEQPIQCAPETIIDTRLRDAEEKGHFRCDSCTPWFRGSYQSQFLPGVREISFDDLIDGWQDGSVDASWYCVECWSTYFHEERKWEGDTRARLGLPPASRPSAIRDQRFHDKGGRWAWCDRCGSYCRGRAVTTSTATSSTAPTTRLRDRCTSVPRASPRLPSGTTSGRLDNGMPHPHAGHASRGCGRRQRKPSWAGCSWTWATKATTSTPIAAEAVRGPTPAVWRGVSRIRPGADRLGGAGPRDGGDEVTSLQVALLSL